MERFFTQGVTGGTGVNGLREVQYKLDRNGSKHDFIDSTVYIANCF